MSRQMAFWRYNDGVYLDNQKVYEEACCNGLTVEGLAELPTEDILRMICEKLPAYDKLDEYSFESEKGAFELSYTNQCILFDCSWDMPMNDLNTVIDIMAAFHCPFYDPQITKRFDSAG